MIPTWGTFDMSFFSQVFPGKTEPSHEAGTEIILQAYQHLAPWRIKSVPAFRNVLLGEGGMIASPVIDFGSNEIITSLIKTLRKTVAEGRLIDFGHIGNDVIKTESLRSREAFEAHELIMPFDSWVALSSWEGGHCAYFYIRPSWDENVIIATEIYGLSIPDLGNLCRAHDTFLLYDQIVVTVEGPGKTVVRPMPLADERLQPGVTDFALRGSNVLDPLVTFLRFLNDASCPVTKVPAPDKLNKARAKNGKQPIPAHYTVPAHDYITHLRAQEATSRILQTGRQGGTHASPVPHYRRSHKRHLRTGEVIDVRSSKVNFRSVDEMHRLFYTVKLK